MMMSVILLLLNGCDNHARSISVEQFYTLLEPVRETGSEGRSQNGFGAAEKVCIPAGLPAPLASGRVISAFGGYVIPCCFRVSPTVTYRASRRVSVSVSGVASEVGADGLIWCFLSEGGRGSEILGATGICNWIPPQKIISYSTGGHRHG